MVSATFRSGSLILGLCRQRLAILVPLEAVILVTLAAITTSVPPPLLILGLEITVARHSRNAEDNHLVQPKVTYNGLVQQ